LIRHRRASQAEIRRFVLYCSHRLLALVRLPEKENTMYTRATLAMALVSALAQPLHADARLADPCVPGHHQTSIEDVRAPQTDNHAQILRQIAISASVGNRTNVEILTARLRTMGVDAEAIDEAVAWTQLHGSSPHHTPSSDTRMKPSPVEPGWEG
jgi:hypothetical protein